MQKSVMSKINRDHIGRQIAQDGAFWGGSEQQGKWKSSALPNRWCSYNTTDYVKALAQETVEYK